MLAAELEKQSKPKAKHTNNYSKEVGLILAALREFSQKFLWQSLVPHTHLCKHWYNNREGKTQQIPAQIREYSQGECQWLDLNFWGRWEFWC